MMASAAKKEKEETLADVADREATEAEEEFAGLETGAPDDEAEDQPEYTAPVPSKKDIDTANKVYAAIKKVDIHGADGAVSALLQLIDIHPKFTRPQEWPGKEEEEYHESELLHEMALILTKGCKKLTVDPKDLIFLWRNKEKWEQGGSTVRGNVKSFPKRVIFLLKGKTDCIEMNFHHWKAMNPLQRIFSLYHELRRAAQPKPDFTGYYDEVETFGSRVFRDMVELRRVMEVGAQVQHQFQLPLFEDDG